MIKYIICLTDSLRVNNWTKSAGILRAVVQRVVPAPEAGHDCHPRLRGRRHGELGAHHVPGDGTAV